MSRAQRLALAAALASPGLAAAGCAETTEPGDGVIVAGATAAGAGAGAGVGGTRMEGVAGIAVYGAPMPVYGAPAAGNPSPPPVAGNVSVPVYGVPIAGNPGKPPMDGGVDPDEDGGPVVTPVYGASPPQD